MKRRTPERQDSRRRALTETHVFADGFELTLTFDDSLMFVGVPVQYRKFALDRFYRWIDEGRGGVAE